MGNPKQFCAVESVRAGDPLPGTATHPERNLLLSWPRRYWERNLRHASNMAPSLVSRLDGLAASGRRVNLIYRRQEPEDSHRILLFPEGLAFDITPDQLEDFLEDVQQGSDLAPWAGRPVTRPVMLCCTHGKKDKCCAKFGYDTYRALQAEIAQRDLPVDLWESSHLGGCRLAASLITFPSRRKYGRIGRDDTKALLEHEIRDRAYLPCYRGNGRLTPAQQCAETAALEWLARQEINAEDLVVEPVPAEQSGPDVEVRVRWTSGPDTGVLVAQCVQREIQRVDTCADLDEGPTSSWCWMVSAIAPEEASRIASILGQWGAGGH
ncbi:sucrase ferredoxin [Marinobacter sp. OP 3.4]|uniref:sucrase ferredoxin n=1 Tax=Marinobacter sp. OP 3.4 TaxID=3076501 RepID=UPI002E1D64D1